MQPSIVICRSGWNQAQFGVKVRKRRGSKKAKAKGTPPPVVDTAVPSKHDNETQPNQSKETQNA